VPLGSIGAGASLNVGIPEYAKDVHVSRRPSGAVGAPPAMQVHLRPTIFVANMIASEQYALGISMTRPMPIEPGAGAIQVNNLSGSNMLATAVFGLAI